MAKKYEIITTTRTKQIVTPPDGVQDDLVEVIKREYPPILTACMKMHVNDVEIVDIQVKAVDE